MRPLVRTVLFALLLAIIVAFVFSLVTGISQYTGIAGLITFLAVLLSGYMGGKPAI